MKNIAYLLCPLRGLLFVSWLAFYQAAQSLLRPMPPRGVPGFLGLGWRQDRSCDHQPDSRMHTALGRLSPSKSTGFAASGHQEVPSALQFTFCPPMLSSWVCWGTTVRTLLPPGQHTTGLSHFPPLPASLSLWSALPLPSLLGPPSIIALIDSGFWGGRETNKKNSQSKVCLEPFPFLSLPNKSPPRDRESMGAGWLPGGRQRKDGDKMEGTPPERVLPYQSYPKLDVSVECTA